MNESRLQVGKTRDTPLPGSLSPRVLTGEVEKETQRLIAECWERHQLTLLALETDEDHIHVEVSASPRFSPALIANAAQRAHVTVFAREVPPSLKGVWEGPSVDQE